MIRWKQTNYSMDLMGFLVKSKKKQEKRKKKKFILTTIHKQTYIRSLSCFCDVEQFAGTLYLNSFVDSGIHCSNSKIIIIIKKIRFGHSYFDRQILSHGEHWQFDASRWTEHLNEFREKRATKVFTNYIYRLEFQICSYWDFDQTNPIDCSIYWKIGPVIWYFICKK